MGGDGSDTLRGRGGFDLLDGDAYLNVRIGININGVYYSAESLNTDSNVGGQYAGRVYAMVGNNPSGEVDFAAGPAFGGRSLSSLLLDRTINPGDMSIVREIKYDDSDISSDSMNIDTAVFHGTLAEYDIEGRTVDANGVQLTRARDVNGDGFISVRDRDDGVTGATVNGVVLDSRRLLVDDTDLIKNIEHLRFADQTLVIGGPNQRPTGAVVISDLTPTEGRQLTLDTSTIADVNGLGAFSYRWQSSVNGSAWSNIAGATAATFTPDDNANILPGDQAGLLLRAIVSYIDGEGRAESVTSAPTGPVGLDWDGLTGVTNAFAGNPGDDIANGANLNDTLNGNDGDDDLGGAGGADQVNGGNGNDILAGGGGGDTLSGGAGNDVLTGGGANDTVNGDAGNDTINYVVGDGNDTVNGGADVDTLVIAGTAAADTLNVVYNGTLITQVGTGGSITGVESVTVDLGAAADTLVYTTTPTSNLTVNLAAGIAAGFATIANVENVTGGAGNDTLHPASAANNAP